MLSTLLIPPVPTSEDGIIAQDKAMVINMQTSSSQSNTNETKHAEGEYKIPDEKEQKLEENDDNSDNSSIATLEDEDNVSVPVNIVTGDALNTTQVKIEGSSLLSGNIPSIEKKSAEEQSIKTAETAMVTVPPEEKELEAELEEEKELFKPQPTKENISVPPKESEASKSTTAKVGPFTKHASTTRMGLRNLGNTCYLNSALQMLYSLLYQIHH